jgi:transcriptional regulator with XRE-family HTH domain
MSTDRRMRPKTTVLHGRALLERWIQRGRMTQQEAANQIGISRVKLNQYLNAAALPSLETAIRIEDATGIGSRAWLLPDVTGRNSAAGESGPAESAAGEARVNEVNHNRVE